MTGYTFEDAVRDRDEAYRLLAEAEARLDAVGEIVGGDEPETYQTMYGEGGRVIARVRLDDLRASP